MGFEPFVLPRRHTEPSSPAVGQARTREERVHALAQQLHQRGLTSSMTDARRLAEGMVDVEQKVMKQTPKPQEGSSERNSMPGVRGNPSSTTTMKDVPTQLDTAGWPNRFRDFVKTAAAQPETRPEHAIPVIKPSSSQHAVQPSDALPMTQSTSVIDEPRRPTTTPEALRSADSVASAQSRPRMTYGREEQHRVAEVPHTNASRQMFFEDAPPITAARGYSGPKPQKVEFMAQKMDLRPKQPQTPTPTVTAPEPRVRETVDIVVEDAGVQITKTEETPTSSATQETTIVVDVPHPAVNAVDPTPTPSSLPPTETEPRSETKPPAPKPASGPGSVDIFEFFKKKG
ncbi:TPA: hypothetical protein HA251_04445 [Candidatus Woesearchaeota archaeon]|nr:hypothetical protein [Candidatus Woesearchaeota archaeon]